MAEKKTKKASKKTKKSTKEETSNVENEVVEQQRKEMLEQAGLDESKLKEIEKKIKEIDAKIEKYKDAIVKKFNKYIFSVGLLPPTQEGQKELNTVIIIDDRDSKKLSKEELKEKIQKNCSEIAKSIDENIVNHIYLLTQVYDACDEGKTEVLDELKHAKVFHDVGVLDAIKVGSVHKDLVLAKFEKYIVSYVCAGTVFRGEAHEKSDIDAFVIIDDTDVKTISRFELRDKLTNMMYQMVYEAHARTGVERKLHVQTYLLTDFWDFLRDGSSPVIMTFLRDGIPFHDRGIYIAWKQLLKMGRVKPSIESVKMHKESATHFVSRAKKKLVEAFCEDCFYACTNPSQSLLMMYGYPATTPKETIRLMEEVFVKKEKLLDKKWIKVLEKAVENWKKYEYGEIKEVDTKDVDEMITNTFRYVEEIEKLYTKVEVISNKNMLEDLYDQAVKITMEAFDVTDIKKPTPTNLLKEFKKSFVESGTLESKFLEILKDIIELKKDTKKVSTETFNMEKIQRDVRSYLHCLNAYVTKTRMNRAAKSKLVLDVNGKQAEVIFFATNAFFIEDIKKQDKIIKAVISPSGKVSQANKSNKKELEQAIKQGQFGDKLELTPEFFASLEEVFGTDKIKVKFY